MRSNWSVRPSDSCSEFAILPRSSSLVKMPSVGGHVPTQTVAPASASAFAIAKPNPPSSDTPATKARLPFRSIGSIADPSPADGRAGPGEPRAERGEDEQIAAAEPPGPERLVEGNGNGGRRGIAVPVDIGEDLVGPQSGHLLDHFDDAAIRLVRHQQFHVARREPVGLQRELHGLGHEHRGELEHLAPVHHRPVLALPQHLLAHVGVVRQTGAVDPQLFRMTAVGEEMHGEDATPRVLGGAEHHRAVAGLEMVGSAGTVDDAVEVAGLQAGLGQGLAGGLPRQRDAGLAVRHPVARLDAAALHDPLVGRVHEPRQVVVGDDPGGDVKAGGDELGARHQDASRYLLRATGERGRFRPRVAKARDAHGSDGHAAAVRGCPGSETSSGRAEAGTRPRHAVGLGLRAPAHVRGGDRAERAVRLERSHRRGWKRDARLARVRRSREGHPHAPGLLTTTMSRRFALLGILTLPLFLFPLPRLSAQRRAITFDDYIALRSVGDPQLSPDGKWVAYTVTEQSLKDNRGTTRIWLADVATGQGRELTAGPGSDRQPRWSPDGKTLAFVSTRQHGGQLWVLSLAGGEARQVTTLPDGVFDPVWLPDGKALLVTSDIKWPAAQEMDRRAGDYPTEARLWTGLFYRHWDDWRAGKRQHVFRVSLAGDGAKDLTPMDYDAPTIATGGDGDVAGAPDGKEIAVANHLDSTVAGNPR